MLFSIRIPRSDGDQFGPFRVETLCNPAEARERAIPFLMRRPFANLPLFGELAPGRAESSQPVTCVLSQEGETKAVFIAGAEQDVFMSHVEPAALPDVLAFVERKLIPATAEGQIVMDMHSSLEGPVTSAWKQLTGANSKSTDVDDYYVYSPDFCPPLPSSLQAQPARKMTEFPKEWDAATRAEFPNPYQTAGASKSLRQMFFNVAPVSESGLLVDRISAACNVPDKIAARGMSAIAEKVRPHMAAHFTALAQMAREQKRWVAFSVKHRNEPLGTASVLKKLGFADGGSHILMGLACRSGNPRL